MYAMKRVLIISHADADGHVIAEQTRRNLSTIPGFDVSVLVDSERTKNHRTWTRLDALPEIEPCEIVFFVDLMFAPLSFAEEVDALVAFAEARPDKMFVVLDHHPLPLRLLYRAPNLRPVYRPDVVDCTFGPPSWMMVIAAMLEAQPTRSRKMREPGDKALAKGIRRAAVPGSRLAGAKLLALMRCGWWEELRALGEEDASFHPMPRGRRPAGAPTSALTLRLEEFANTLIHSREDPAPARGLTSRRSPMSYDYDDAEGSSPFTSSITPSDPQDLEAIMTLLEISAVFLTDSPESVFTAHDLVAKAKDIAGDEVPLRVEDVNIVLGKAGFLMEVKAGRFQLKKPVAPKRR